jgi:predicted RecB family nuclease
MHKKNNRLVFSPSDLTVYIDSPFDSWMDRHDKEFPGEFVADETDANTKILQTHGDKHEKAFLQALKDRALDVFEITGYGDQSQQETRAEIQRGHEVIFQAVLAKDEFAGKSDFLFRVNGASNLGDYHYEAWDTKLAKKAKPYFAMQLCCYSEMLEHIQGRLPEFFRVVLGDLTEKEFRTEDFINYYRHLKQSFLSFQRDFCKDNQPLDCTAGTFSPWKSVSEQILEERDDLSRVAGMRKLQRSRLKSVGISTLTELSKTSETSIGKIKPEILERLKKQAQLQIQTVATGKTAFEPLPHVKGKGFALLPPASAADVFFDMEGYPHVDEGLEYLFGAVLRGAAGPEFKDWWAHDRREEQVAFESFVDWVYARWLATPSTHIDRAFFLL